MADNDDRISSLTQAVANAASEGDPATEIAGALIGGSTPQININLVVQQFTEKTNDPDIAVKKIDELIELKRKYDAYELETLKNRGEVIIELKTKDPDEIDKLKGSANLRGMGWMCFGIAISCFGGAIAVAVAGSYAVLMVPLAAAGIFALAIAGALASGETVRSRDAAHILQALGSLVRKRGAESGRGPDRKEITGN